MSQRGSLIWKQPLSGAREAHPAIFRKCRQKSCVYPTASAPAYRPTSIRDQQYINPTQCLQFTIAQDLFLPNMG